MTFYVSGLKFHRLPVCNSSSPTDEDYDLLVSALQGTKFNAPVIINCQVIIIIIIIIIIIVIIMIITSGRPLQIHYRQCHRLPVQRIPGQ